MPPAGKDICLFESYAVDHTSGPAVRFSRSKASRVQGTEQFSRARSAHSHQCGMTFSLALKLRVPHVVTVSPVCLDRKGKIPQSLPNLISSISSQH